MFRSLQTTLPALALSLAVALGTVGATATPARADADDAARIIGGIIALYAIGRALEGSSGGHVTRGHTYYPYQTQRVAPAHCYREFQTHHGYFRGYSGRCLQRSVNYGLPDACARQYHTNRGLRTFYGGRCMAQNGWVRGH